MQKRKQSASSGPLIPLPRPRKQLRKPSIAPERNEPESLAQLTAACMRYSESPRFSEQQLEPPIAPKLNEQETLVQLTAACARYFEDPRFSEAGYGSMYTSNSGSITLFCNPDYPANYATKSPLTAVTGVELKVGRDYYNKVYAFFIFKVDSNYIGEYQVPCDDIVKRLELYYPPPTWKKNSKLTLKDIVAGCRTYFKDWKLFMYYPVFIVTTNELTEANKWVEILCGKWDPEKLSKDVKSFRIWPFREKSEYTAYSRGGDYTATTPPMHAKAVWDVISTQTKEQQALLRTPEDLQTLLKTYFPFPSENRRRQLTVEKTRLIEDERRGGEKRNEDALRASMQEKINRLASNCVVDVEGLKLWISCHVNNNILEMKELLNADAYRMLDGDQNIQYAAAAIVREAKKAFANACTEDDVSDLIHASLVE